MTDPQQRIVFCNDRYLEIYGLARSDIPRNMTGPQLLEMRRERGVLDFSVEDFYERRQRRKVSLPNCPAGNRCWSDILRCRTAARS